MTKQYIEIDEEGSKFYYKDKKMTKLHREDGPAVEWAGGDKQWYINDVSLTEKEFNARNNPVELSLEDIAAKFNIDVSKLKIIK
jgi:hypothetical protein